MVFEVLYVAFFIGVLGLSALALLAVMGRSPGWSRRMVAVVAGIGIAALIARTIVAGHPPIFGTFENTLTASVSLLVAAAWTSWRRESVGAWAWALPWAVVLMLYGTLFRSEATSLTISEQSLWVDVHVVFAWMSFVGFVLASSLAVARLRGRTFWGLDPQQADELIARALNMGFLALTATMIVGGWYLYLLFAVFWRWDVVGTLTLAAWLGYGMVIHARYFYGLEGRRLAAATLAVLPFLILAFWVWSVFPGTYHFFDVPLMKPY